MHPSETTPLCRRRALSAIVGLIVFTSIAGFGCDLGQSCSAVYAPSGAFLTLHLPPQADVTQPETLTVCREPDCATATLPVALPPTMVATFATSRPEVTGTLTVVAGGVRVVEISWILQKGDVNSADPRNDYMVNATDATGATTGQLSGEVTYAHSEGCLGDDIWRAHLSD
jgi:hypothetical protein